MNSNDKPNYVLKFNDSSLRKVNDKNHKIKMAVIIIIAILVIGSFVFQDNLFLELSWTARILLICIAVGVMFTGKSEEVPTPAELRFYNNYLVLFIQNKYFSKKLTRQEYFIFNYDEITKIKFLENSHSKRIHIYGNTYAIWYDFNKDGTLPSTPTYNRKVNETLAYFTTHLNSNIDFVKEIESHCPIKVDIENK